MSAVSEFKDRERLVEYIMRVRNKDAAKSAMRDEESCSFALMIDNILSYMNKNESDIIRNEYILRYPRNWWQNYYSKSGYYRVKGNALKNFLRLSKL